MDGSFLKTVITVNEVQFSKALWFIVETDGGNSIVSTEIPLRELTPSIFIYSCIINSLIEEQFKKALSPNLVILFSIIKLVKFVQLLNVSFGISEILLVIVAVVKNSQSLNTASPNVRTVSGTSILVKLLPSKQLLFICITELGISKVIKPLL